MQKIITDLQVWDKFVAKSPQGSVFCISAWLKLYDEWRTVGLYRNDSLIGAVPFIRNSSGYNVNLTPYQGILCENDHLQYRLAEEIATSFLFPIGLSFHWSFQDIRPFIWDGYSQKVKFTYVVNSEWVMENLEKDTRYLVRQYLKNGSVVSKGCPDKFWDIYYTTFQRKGLPLPIEKRFFDQMIKTIPNDVFLCEKDGVVTSGAVIIYDNKRGHYILGGSDGEGSSSLTVYTALVEAFKKVTEVDLVGCNNQKIGLFKRGFGGILTPYYQVFK